MAEGWFVTSETVYERCSFPLCSFEDHLFWWKACLEDTQAFLRRSLGSKELRPPANSYLESGFLSSNQTCSLPLDCNLMRDPEPEQISPF
jgi:hypothetical protein